MRIKKVSRQEPQLRVEIDSGLQGRGDGWVEDHQVALPGDGLAPIVAEPVGDAEIAYDKDMFAPTAPGNVVPPPEDLVPVAAIADAGQGLADRADHFAAERSFLVLVALGADPDQPVADLLDPIREAFRLADVVGLQQQALHAPAPQ